MLWETQRQQKWGHSRKLRLWHIQLWQMLNTACQVVRLRKRSPEWQWIKDRGKPSKIEQRKVREREWGPQVEQTALLASPIYIRQSQGKEKKIYIYNKRSQRARGRSLSCAHTLSVSVSLFSLCLLDQHALIPRGCICLYFLNKTDLSKNYNTGCPRAVTRQGL